MSELTVRGTRDIRKTDIVNPSSIRHMNPKTNGLRLPTRSEKKAATTAQMAAVM